MTESFYDLLGVPSDVDTDEIQRAYRQRIKETHPDLNDDPDASEQTARLVEARDVLTDDAERARYDRLGHEAYVNDGFGTAGGAGASSASAPGRDGSSHSDGPPDNDGSSGPSNARASTEERRRRERRAREDVNFGADGRSSSRANDGTSSTGPEPGERTADSTTGDSSSGGSSTGSATNRTANGNPRGARSTTATNEPPSWSDTSDGWAAHTPTRAPPGLARHVFAAVTEAHATAIVTFLLYPLLVLGAFLPSFPLVVNVIVGACLLAMIAAAQSVPGLGIAIYGTWSLIGPVGLLWVEQSPFSPVGLIVLGTTWLPLGFSLLTYKLLDA